MEDFDPIGEEQTLFKKLKGFFKNKFSKKHIFVEIHSPSKDMVEEVSKQLLLFNNEIMSDIAIKF